jgi:DNA replication protein DnaC
VNKSQDGAQAKNTPNCKLCNDSGQVVDEEFDGTYLNIKGVRPCECAIMKQYEEMIEKSEFKGLIDRYRFEDYAPKNKDQDIALKQAKKYVEDFDNIRTQMNNSIAFLGQSGSGKTMLSVCIGKGLMQGKKIPVKYMSYINDIQNLKMAKTQSYECPDIYITEINKFKSAPLLIVDDLFKTKDNDTTKITAADVTIIFDIYNYFQAKGKPIITSSQFTVNELRDVDEALTGRIIEMSRGRVNEFFGKELNHRFR